MNENEENIDEIRRDIEDTRQRISTEIGAIEGKLSPEHAKDVVMDKVHETRGRVADRIGGTAAMVRGRANRVGADIGSAVRANPIPIALIGVGTGWLVWETMRPARRELIAEPLVDLDTDLEVDVEAADYATGVMGPVPVDMRGDGHRQSEERRLAAARDRASDLAAGARERAYAAKDRASHLAHDARDRASHLAHDARDRASHLAHDAKERSRIAAQRSRERAIRARDRTTRSYESSPIAFGALALMAGVGIGMLLPHTRREDRVLGRSRDRVITRARRIADEVKDVAVDSVREGFREGAHAARETAKREAEERDLIR